jgi:hypothetical protein
LGEVASKQKTATASNNDSAIGVVGHWGDFLVVVVVGMWRVRLDELEGLRSNSVTTDQDALGCVGWLRGMWMWTWMC